MEGRNWRTLWGYEHGRDLEGTRAGSQFEAGHGESAERIEQSMRLSVQLMRPYGVLQL